MPLVDNFDASPMLLSSPGTVSLPAQGCPEDSLTVIDGPFPIDGRTLGDVSLAMDASSHVTHKEERIPPPVEDRGSQNITASGDLGVISGRKNSAPEHSSMDPNVKILYRSRAGFEESVMSDHNSGEGGKISTSVEVPTVSLVLGKGNKNLSTTLQLGGDILISGGLTTHKSNMIQPVVLTGVNCETRGLEENTPGSDRTENSSVENSLTPDILAIVGSNRIGSKFSFTDNGRSTNLPTAQELTTWEQSRGDVFNSNGALALLRLDDSDYDGFTSDIVEHHHHRAPLVATPEVLGAVEQRSHSKAAAADATRDGRIFNVSSNQKMGTIPRRELLVEQEKMTNRKEFDSGEGVQDENMVASLPGQPSLNSTVATSNQVEGTPHTSEGAEMNSRGRKFKFHSSVEGAKQEGKSSVGSVSHVLFDSPKVQGSAGEWGCQEINGSNSKAPQGLLGQSAIQPHLYHAGNSAPRLNESAMTDAKGKTALHLEEGRLTWDNSINIDVRVSPKQQLARNREQQSMRSGPRSASRVRVIAFGSPSSHDILNGGDPEESRLGCSSGSEEETAAEHEHFQGWNRSSTGDETRVSGKLPKTVSSTSPVSNTSASVSQSRGDKAIHTKKLYSTADGDPVNEIGTQETGMGVMGCVDSTRSLLVAQVNNNCEDANLTIGKGDSDHHFPQSSIGGWVTSGHAFVDDRSVVLDHNEKTVSTTFCGGDDSTTLHQLDKRGVTSLRSQVSQYLTSSERAPTEVRKVKVASDSASSQQKVSPLTGNDVVKAGKSRANGDEGATSIDAAYGPGAGNLEEGLESDEKAVLGVSEQCYGQTVPPSRPVTSRSGVLKSIACTGTRLLDNSGSEDQLNMFFGSRTGRRRSVGTSSKEISQTPILRRSSSGGVWKYGEPGQVYQNAAVNAAEKLCLPANTSTRRSYMCSEINLDPNRHLASHIDLQLGNDRKNNQQQLRSVHCSDSPIKSVHGGPRAVFNVLHAGYRDGVNGDGVLFQENVNGIARTEPFGETKAFLKDVKIIGAQQDLAVGGKMIGKGRVFVKSFGKTEAGEDVLNELTASEALPPLNEGAVFKENRNVIALKPVVGAVEEPAASDGWEISAAIKVDGEDRLCQAAGHHTVIPSLAGVNDTRPENLGPKQALGFGGSMISAYIKKVEADRTLGLMTATAFPVEDEINTYNVHGFSNAPDKATEAAGDRQLSDELAVALAMRISNVEGARHGQAFADGGQALMGAIHGTKPECSATAMKVSVFICKHSSHPPMLAKLVWSGVLISTTIWNKSFAHSKGRMVVMPN